MEEEEEEEKGDRKDLFRSLSATSKHFFMLEVAEEESSASPSSEGNRTRKRLKSRKST